jgi:hypothetical protein
MSQNEPMGHEFKPCIRKGKKAYKLSVWDRVNDAKKAEGLAIPFEGSTKEFAIYDANGEFIGAYFLGRVDEYQNMAMDFYYGSMRKGLIREE